MPAEHICPRSPRHIDQIGQCEGHRAKRASNGIDGPDALSDGEACNTIR